MFSKNKELAVPDNLVFYTNPMSRGRIARWMLEEVGAPYRTEMLDFGPTMKNPAYLAINPMGKVPAIKHGDTVVTECAAICAYLADAFPAAKLAPPTDKRGDYYRWLFFTAGPVEAAVSNNALGLKVPPEREGTIGYGTFGRVMDTLERAVSAGPYIAGDTFTAADVYVGSHISWGLQFGSIEKRKAFEDYWARLEKRPAHLRATELDNAAMPKQS
jgi:glutathione S-transferase